MLNVSHKTSKIEGNVALPISKSIANRLLVLNYVVGKTQPTEASNQDINTMQKAIDAIINNQTIDAGEAGTVLRFSLALAAASPHYEGKIIGHPRLFERPIDDLVDILTSLGAKIEKTDAAIIVKGQKLKGKELVLSNVESSQFISALMMIAPLIENDLTLTIQPNQNSMSYIDLTAQLMQQMGFEIRKKHNSWTIASAIAKTTDPPNIEKDWSAASYFFSLALAANTCDIFIEDLQLSSIQGDCIFIKKWIEDGVFNFKIKGNGILVVGVNKEKIPNWVDFKNQPDIALNFILAMAMNKLCFTATGLKTLNLNESPRLNILIKNLEKLNVQVVLMDDETIQIDAQHINFSPIIINSYNDHRIAMTFAHLGLKTTCQIEGEDSVKKSFPHYWEQLKQLNFDLQ